jgi:histidine ammonia-lyase
MAQRALQPLLVGERDAWYKGELVPADKALKQAGIEAIQLGPKESLAIMNGTSVMGALACLSFERATELSPERASDWHNIGVANARLGRDEPLGSHRERHRRGSGRGAG